MQNSRLVKIGKKMDIADRLIAIAKAGISSANRNNPFWNKSDAMKAFNSAMNYKRKLSSIWILEQKL